ncbi:MAG: FCD domain-containing protein [Chloroflexi bacterium]|nr:FCD domain-containing protein [Chloroflexota bacterium]
MLKTNPSFDLLEYLAIAGNGFSERLPSLESLSTQFGVSVSVLREQLQVARALGLVEVRPRTGIRRLPYSFAPAVRESLFYALARDRKAFDQFADVRRHLERAYWFEAVEKLEPEDIAHLQDLVRRAEEMLHGDPIRVPHAEHRELHLTIFRHLENPFVIGLMEAYWSAYEKVGLNRYAGIKYLEQVWDYHRGMVEAIAAGDTAKGHQLLNTHFDLIDKILE